MADCKLERVAIIIDTENADFVQLLGNGPRETVNTGQLANAIRAVADRIERVHAYGQTDSGTTVQALQEIEVVVDRNGNQVGIVRWQHEDTPWEWLLTDKARDPEWTAAQLARAQVVTPRLEVDDKDFDQLQTWADAEEMVTTVNGTVRLFCLIGDNTPAGNATDVPVSAAVAGCEYRMVVRFASGHERSYSQPGDVIDDCEYIFLDVDAEVDM